MFQLIYTLNVTCKLIKSQFKSFECFIIIIVNNKYQMQENNYHAKRSFPFHVVSSLHLKSMKCFKYVLYGLLSSKHIMLSALLFIILSMYTSSVFLAKTDTIFNGHSYICFHSMNEYSQLFTIACLTMVNNAGFFFRDLYFFFAAKLM